ncbi:hypothetical protein [Paracoccus contaminans]|uniref:Uncharacterized protein n=1 Tax=Paracoccus contaminans TaxID=1945662 RepID=A0A1W6CXA8_9RHOB|nr:hypothetical protein [Paracoccus contaminans]ARJ69409.1 hypothetical protein B0A89_06975 [Paracoccus contaminans]
MNSRQALGGALLAAGPLLAGMGRAGGWAAGLLAVLSAAALVLARPGRIWATPLHLAGAAAAAALGTGLLFLAGLSLGIVAPWGAPGPLALSGAGAILAGTDWFAVRR